MIEIQVEDCTCASGVREGPWSSTFPCIVVQTGHTLRVAVACHIHGDGDNGADGKNASVDG